MRVEQSIREFLYQRSKGLIDISIQDARHIIDLVTGKPMAGEAVAKLFRYNACSNVWDLIRAVTTTDADIQKEIVEALNGTPVDKFYRWECYNAAGEFEGNILTINTNLF